MEPFEPAQQLLFTIASLIKLILEGVSIFCVLLGLLQTVKFILTLPRSVRRQLPFTEIRLLFGSWLALALEFQLGADILATTISPSLTKLGELAMLAVIRTFLNYFLTKELEQECLQKESNHPTTPSGV